MEPGVARAWLDFDTAERFVPLRRRLGVTWEDEHGVSPQQLPLPDDLPSG